MPDVRMPDGSIIKNVPEGTTRSQLMARLQKAKTPAGRGEGIGEKIDAVGRGIADMATFGFADELAARANAILPLDKGSVSIWGGRSFDDAVRANEALQRARDSYDERKAPIARTVGQVAGALALPGPGTAAKLGSRLAVNAGQGAAYGFGSGNGSLRDRGDAAMKAGISAAAAGEVGRAAVKGIGRVLAPKVDDSVRALAKEGVTMTPGQILGGGFKAVEDKATSVPILGNAVVGARRRGLEQFNRAAINRSLKSLGTKLPDNVKTGRDALGHAQKVFDQAYDAAREGMDFAADETFNSAIDDLQQRATAGALAPDKAARFQAILQNGVARRMTDGRMDGKTYKVIVSDLKKQAMRLTKPTATAEENELGDALMELVGHIDDAARRVSDPRAVRLMDAADEGYAQLVRVEKAAGAAGAKEGVFTPAMFERAVKNADNTARRRAFLRGDALMQDLADNGQAVLPATIPDSGTAGRLLPWLAAGGMGGGAAMAPQAIPAIAGTAAGLAGAAGAASIPYRAGVAPAVQNMLIRRPRGMFGAGQRLAQFATPLGAAGGLIAADAALR